MVHVWLVYYVGRVWLCGSIKQQITKRRKKQQQQKNTPKTFCFDKFGSVPNCCCCMFACCYVFHCSFIRAVACVIFCRRCCCRFESIWTIWECILYICLCVSALIFFVCSFSSSTSRCFIIIIFWFFLLLFFSFER